MPDRNRASFRKVFARFQDTSLRGSTSAHRPRWRVALSLELVILTVAVFFAFTANGAFWAEVKQTGIVHGSRGIKLYIGITLALIGLHGLLFGLLLNRWTAKPVLVTLLLVTSLAAHFMSQYTIYLDPDMVRNVLHTDGKESGELISLGVVPSLLILGVVPSLLVWRVRLRQRPLGKALLVRAATLVAALLVAVVAALVSFPNLSALMRNHHEVRHLITPGNYLVSLGRVMLEDEAGKHRPRTPLGLQAKVVGRPADARPRLLVLVVGETVRAQNWGLDGYARDTTPQLARIDPINFRDVTSCGSATEVSVPCMFSPWGREHYDKDRVRHSESLLHVLQHLLLAHLLLLARLLLLRRRALLATALLGEGRAGEDDRRQAQRQQDLVTIVRSHVLPPP